ncbi:sugar ABC transporter permease [Paenibacillus aceris]|uniref:Multiple sugar transport system permease protein n=2 Tax=Paenibacillus aceris TaxID=869555 RepID=A0ABS4I8I3_9BACL|nr:sugar ABC transporter permease [Paenibacillus aceris]MBP1967163.1 multiple sugar transport system permease protein [Paenibacillus aceris]NHW35561.1 sugar ABC transporter permease [Paenibacillus aceris]
MKMQRLARRELFVALSFLTPSFIGFCLFYLIPFGTSLLYSFQDGLNRSSLTLSNYKELLLSSSFQKAAANTFWFTAVSVPILVTLSLVVALLLNQRVFFRNLLRTAYVLPLVVPVASIVLVWQILFDWNGAMNVVLNHFGLNRIDWMKSDWAGFVVILIYIWKNIGYNVVLFLAGLQNIPDQYYEIANLEGASSRRKFFSITLVYLTPTTFLVVLMSILNSFKVFRETYLVAGAYPHDRIYMMQHYMNNMFLSLDIQKLSAAATLMALSILVLVLILFRAEKKFRSFME